MWNRASAVKLLLSLAAFVAFMILLLPALGFGMGIPELMLWLVIVVVGSVLIIRRHRTAKAAGRTESTGSAVSL